MIAPRLRFPLTVFALALSTFLALFAGCGLSTGGIPSADGGTACTDDGQCDDDDPCTVDKCGGEGTCAHTAVPDGPAPAASQIAGDCHTILCTAGMRSTEVDDTDKPDTHNPCVVDECSSGMPLQDLTANDGHPCTLAGAPAACTSGVCTVACKKASDCPSQGACVIASCDGVKGLCIFNDVPDGTETPGATQTPGDCHVHICLGGVDTNQEDDSDVPPVTSDCVDAKCTAGVPSNPPHGADSPCSTNGGQVCDGAGTCVPCNPTSTSKCAGSDTDCESRTCVNHVCGISYQPGTTVATDQSMAMACHQVRCNGSGGYQVVVDDAILPVDVTGCQNGVCTSGVPSFTKKPNGTSCGTMLACLNGTCAGCTMNAQCQPPAYSTCGGGGTPNVCGCTPTTCLALKDTCGNPSNGCGSNLACSNGLKDGSETDIDCGGGNTPQGNCAIKCTQGKHCLANSDCSSNFCVDNVCCDTACTGSCQACSIAKKGGGTQGACGPIAANTDPDGECVAQAPSTCGKSGGCNGAGACNTYPAGTVCQAATCSGATTVTTAKKCNSSGMCTTQVPATVDCMNFACSGGACNTTCSSDGACASSAYCNVPTSMCTPKLPNGGSGCSAADQCNSNLCGTNGVCCTASCTPAPPCGLTGACTAGSGACSNAAAGTTCNKVISCSAGVQTVDTKCDGSGACSGGATMNNCPGNTVVCGPGMSCLAGCGSAGSGDSNCASTDYCDGSGAGTCQTKGMPGDPCSAADQCTNGLCFGSGVSAHCCTAACITGSPCGASSCDNTGACAYPSNACSAPATCTGNMLTTYNTCSMGTCSGGTTAPCQDMLVCQGNQCGCGANSSAGDANCLSGTWCDGVAPGACQAAQGSGSACTRDSQCISAMGCNMGPHTCH